MGRAFIPAGTASRAALLQATGRSVMSRKIDRNHKIDRSQWSESSKRSFVYHCAGTVYEDINYTCRRCEAKAVFTAEQQKVSFEVKKNYVWQRRTLCAPCDAALFRLKRQHQDMQRRWNAGRKTLALDAAFLAEWLAVIKTFAQYRSRIGAAMGKRLGTLLARLAIPAGGP
jgi:Probable zinc-ribbon domain